MSLGAVAAAAAAAAAGPTLITPTFGTPTVIPGGTGGVDVDTYSGSHTRGAGNGLCMLLFYKSNGSPSPVLDAPTFGAGTAPTVRCTAKVDGANNVGVGIATLDPGVGLEGAQTASAVLDAVRARQGVLIVVDVIGTGGCAGAGEATAVNDGGNTTISDSITPANAASALLSIAGCIDGSGTISVGSGWSSVGTGQSGGTSNDVEALVQSLAPGATSAQTADATFSASRADRALGVVEWLPG